MRCRLQDRAGLAATARPGKSHKVRRPQEPTDLSKLYRAADKAGRGLHEIGRMVCRGDHMHLDRFGEPGSIECKSDRAYTIDTITRPSVKGIRETARASQFFKKPVVSAADRQPRPPNSRALRIPDDVRIDQIESRHRRSDS